MYIYTYNFSVLDFNVEVNMHKKCQPEVAIFTARRELCLFHFSYGETESKAEVK